MALRVDQLRLPFDHDLARVSDDWRACAAALSSVVALEAYEPVGDGPFRHRSAQLDLGNVQAIATAQTDILLQARRCLPGRALLRLPLAGRIAVTQDHRTHILARGRASFDRDDSSDYEARTEGSAILALSFDPQRLAVAAAGLRGPDQDPAVFVSRLPEQRLLDERHALLPLLTTQIQRILNLADQRPGHDRSALNPRLAELLERAVALMLFPELAQPG